MTYISDRKLVSEIISKADFLKYNQDFELKSVFLCLTSLSDLLQPAEAKIILFGFFNA